MTNGEFARRSSKVSQRSALFLAALIGAFGCGADSASSGSTTTIGSDTPTYPACVVQPGPDDPESSVYNPVESAPPFRDLVRTSDAAFIGTVETVSENRWNSDSGEPWCDPSSAGKVESRDQQVRALRLRQVTFNVREVVFQTSDLPLAPGERITVIYPASGGEGQSYDLTPTATMPLTAYNSTPDVGEEVLQLALQEQLPWQGGSKTSTANQSGALGWWTLKGEQATSEVPGRNVALPALTNALVATRRDAEVQLAPNEADRTRINPLGR